MFRTLTTFLALTSVAVTNPVHAHEVSLDTSAARAVLDALANPDLSRADAEQIANMPPNRMVIRKVLSFDEDGTRERYIDELLSAARSEEIEETSFNFDQMKDRLTAVSNTLDAIEADESEFVRWVDDRVSSYSPLGDPMQLDGFIVAGGGSTGFAYGGPEFWLNIGHFRNEPNAAKVVFAHELYHAVQSSARERARLEGKKTLKSMTSAEIAALPDEERDAFVVNAFLTNLLHEGTAMLVGDPELLAKESGPYSKWDVERLRTQQARMDRLAIQLDLSLIALTAPNHVPYQDAYALGFYGPDQPLYYLGYTMAKAIEAQRGGEGIGELISTDGCTFTLAYLEAIEETDGYPPLGEATLRLVDQHCA